MNTYQIMRLPASKSAIEKATTTAVRATDSSLFIYQGKECDLAARALMAVTKKYRESNALRIKRFILCNSLPRGRSSLKEQQKQKVNDNLNHQNIFFISISQNLERKYNILRKRCLLDFPLSFFYRRWLSR